MDLNRSQYSLNSSDDDDTRSLESVDMDIEDEPSIAQIPQNGLVHELRAE
jgi:hypothetical protein